MMYPILYYFPCLLILLWQFSNSIRHTLYPILYSISCLLWQFINSETYSVPPALLYSVFINSIYHKRVWCLYRGQSRKTKNMSKIYDLPVRTACLSLLPQLSCIHDLEQQRKGFLQSESLVKLYQYLSCIVMITMK